MKQMMRAFGLLALISCVAMPLTSQAQDKDTLEMLELFGDVLEKVREDYVEEIDEQKLIESAINGMLTSLDPHSSYLDEKDFQEMRIQTRGEFGGLGIEVTMENGLVKVVSPIDDTPAYKAGLQSGDYISYIDGDPVMGLTLSEAVDKMRGKPNTDIELVILRKGESEPLDYTITRDVIKIKSARVRREADVIYARITSFSEKTSRLLQRGIRDTKKEIGGDLKGMVLDLRNNPGGLLDQAIEVSDLFLNQGEIVSTKGRVEDSNKRFNATKGDMLEDLPIVVLINPGSASASEIVSGALQDHKRAIVLGEKSFGKGSVQTVLPLSTSSGAMRLTTSRYYTPSGRSIQAEGIEPDIRVTQAKLDGDDKKGPQASEASLRGHLSNGNRADAKKGDDKNQTYRDEALAVYDEDYQLGRAIDLVRALFITGDYNKAQ